MMLDEPHADALAMKLASVAIEAERLLRGLERAITGRRMKQDGTLTTDADLAAERLIISRIRQDWADVPVVAEETANAESPSDTFFLVDPLDGTGDFVHGTGEYSVNIALVGTAGRWQRSFRRRPWAGSGSPAKRREGSLSDGGDIVWRDARTPAGPGRT